MFRKLTLPEEELPGKNARAKDSHGGLGTRKGPQGLPRDRSAAYCSHQPRSSPKPAIIYKLG